MRNIREPQLVTGQVVAIPRSLFRDTSWAWFSVQPLANGVSWDRRGGHLDTMRIDGRRLVLVGWAPWHLDPQSQTLTLYTDATLTTTWLHRSERPDVRRVLHDEALTDNGFAIELDFEADAAVPRSVPLCLVARDASDRGGVLIDSGAGDCDKYRR